VTDDVATVAPDEPDVVTDGGDVPRQRGRAALHTMRVVVLSCSLVIVFFGLYAYVLSAVQEQRSQHQLYAQLRGLLDPSSTVAPSIGGHIVPGTPVALLNATAAGLHNVVVVEGTSSSDLLTGPGHLRNSPLPGQPGESIIMGKSATAGAPFAHIVSLRKGDTIDVTTGQGAFRFIVFDQRVAGDPLPHIPPSGAMITLVTATGSSWLGDLAPTHIVYVDAALSGSVVPAPSGRPTTIPTNEIQGHGDPSAWLYVVLWFLGVVAGSFALAWLWARWRFWRAWIISAPVLLGLLWGLSTEVMRLLPNIY
jgi:sortase A